MKALESKSKKRKLIKEAKEVKKLNALESKSKKRKLIKETK